MSPNELGRHVRRQRKRLGLRQGDLAALVGVGTRFVSELENGKPGLELGRALRVINCVGLTLEVRPKSWDSFKTSNES
jgi:y4mF family transcriptional regulator